MRSTSLFAYASLAFATTLPSPPSALAQVSDPTDPPNVPASYSAADRELVGNYEHAYHSVSGGNLRFFALEFSEDFEFGSIESVARRGLRAVESSRRSLAAQGALNRRLFKEGRHLVLGFHDERRDQTCWIAFGSKSPSPKLPSLYQAEYYAGKAAKTPYGWKASNSSPGAPTIVEVERDGGIFSVEFRDPFGKVVALNVTLTPKSELIFAFRLAGGSVRMVGNYDDPADDPTIRSGAVVLDPDVDPIGAAKFAASVFRGHGKSLDNPGMAYNQKLSPGQSLLVVIDDARREETRFCQLRPLPDGWAEFSEGSVEPAEMPIMPLLLQPNKGLPFSAWHEVAIGANRIKVHLEIRPRSIASFTILEPQ